MTFLTGYRYEFLHTLYETAHDTESFLARLNTPTKTNLPNQYKPKDFLDLLSPFLPIVYFL